MQVGARAIVRSTGRGPCYMYMYIYIYIYIYITYYVYIIYTSVAVFQVGPLRNEVPWEWN